jgi:hypothetical protein
LLLLTSSFAWSQQTSGGDVPDSATRRSLSFEKAAGLSPKSPDTYQQSLGLTLLNSTRMRELS